MTRSAYAAPDLRRTRLADALADNAALRAEMAAALAEVARLRKRLGDDVRRQAGMADVRPLRTIR